MYSRSRAHGKRRLYSHPFPRLSVVRLSTWLQLFFMWAGMYSWAWLNIEERRRVVIETHT